MAKQPDPLNPDHPLYSYDDVKRDRAKPNDAEKNLLPIRRHLLKHVGQEVDVFHEIRSETIHLDVLICSPTPNEPYWTLVTSGMSDRPMLSKEKNVEHYAELMLRLPKEWKMPAEGGDGSDKAWQSEEWFWPIRLLKFIARFPHQYNTLIWQRHTLDNGQPPTPWSKPIEFDAVFLVPARTMSEEFDTIGLPDGTKIHIFALYPIYAEESALVRRESADALWAKFVEHEISEVVDPRRSCLVPRTPRPEKKSLWDRLRGK